MSEIMAPLNEKYAAGPLLLQAAEAPPAYRPPGGTFSGF
jgi:hypothetical protein